ncbi:hypothetical protein M501DRAFT_1002043 [Patellaria atrata CBS 101060]|uniref:Uncharacterized protein n=1 Tax=Patellaria atrata CBS 101060 TaxID=1346257 RepID=A0A9P4SEA0_9PEZI|nr:hypothetical protein M501DRAFT_1002043 [Patellaria atrata CBS 101060]
MNIPAQVDIIPTPQLDLLKTNQEAQLDLLKARDVALSKRFEIGFDALGVVTALDAIHESITLAAFIARAHPLFPQTSTYDNANNAQWEFLRGILWNDDPRCLLFDDDDDDNHNFGLGVEFLAEFQFGNPGTLTQRSHYGDLQFLHAMASAEGESPHATKAKIMHWVEVMYKLAAGAQSINPSDKLSAHFPSFFNATTKPSGDATLATLLVGTTPSFTAIDVRKRALGTCLHLIQDSYAVGHTARVVLNPGDMVPRNSSEGTCPVLSSPIPPTPTKLTDKTTSSSPPRVLAASVPSAPSTPTITKTMTATRTTTRSTAPR